MNRVNKEICLASMDRAAMMATVDGGLVLSRASVVGFATHLCEGDETKANALLARFYCNEFWVYVESCLLDLRTQSMAGTIEEFPADQVAEEEG